MSPSAESMQAVVLHGVGDLRLEAIARPIPGAGDGSRNVLVRIGFCGVCGSDIPRIFSKGTYSFPTVCGHEFAGTVEAVSADVEEFSPGDRVAVFPLLWCGECGPCKEEKYAQCVDYDYLGSRCDGAFAEYVVAPVVNLVPVPDGVSLEEASMTEPAAVALHAVRRGGGCSEGETVAIFGIGPIGLMVAQWAKALGASRILLFDIEAAKLEQARSLGFEEVFDSREADPVEVVEGSTAGEGAELTFDGAGVPQTLLQAMAAACRGGRVVMLGNPSGDVTIPAPLISQLMRRETTLHGTWNSHFSSSGGTDDWRDVLSAMAEGTLNLEPLITHRVPLGGAIDVLEGMKDRREFFSKVLIHPAAGGDGEPES
jgi:L-iditol 2-dehydrogenase